MGWLSMTRAGMAPFATPKAYLDAQCTYPPDPGNGRETGLRVLRSSVRSRAWYGACQSYGPDGPGQTFAVICLVRWTPRARDGYIFAYKDLTETAGPCYYDCPAAILALLDPPINDYAARWREACRERLVLTSRPRPVPGQVLVLPEPLTFTDGTAERRFRVARWGSKTVLQRIGDGAFVRISHLMTRAWTIETGDPVVVAA